MKAELHWFDLEHEPILGTLDTESGKFTPEDEKRGAIWAHKIDCLNRTIWVLIGVEGVIGEVRPRGDN